METRIPEQAVEYGFAVGQESPHSTRTLMLGDLQRLLTACPVDAETVDYRAAVLDENVLHKSTMSTRQKTYNHLRQLFALDAGVMVFGVLRDLWDADSDAQPSLAILCAVARDPVLRSTVDFILATDIGALVTPEEFADVITAAFPDRFNDLVAFRIGQHIASSWQQSGHLKGRARKVRDRAECRPAAVAYALLLGHLCGARGDGLFESLWARLLDRSTGEIRDQAVLASRRGWIDYRHAGGVTEIGFSYLMRDDEEAS